MNGKINVQRQSLSGSLEKTKQNRNYSDLLNKPRINDVELVDNKTAKELGLQEEMVEMTAQDIDEILFGKEGMMRSWLRKNI